MLSQSKTALAKVVKNAFIFLIITTGNLSIAALQPIEDEELSSYSGQAAIQVDRIQDSSQKLDFTRMKFGIDVKTHLSIDKLNLGDYDRDGNTGSDILIDKFALGAINKDGSLTPFEIKDPFIDLARDSDTGEVVGFKLGFGSSKGPLSGDIHIVSGAINVDIRDNSENLFGTVLAAKDDQFPSIKPPQPWNPFDLARYLAEVTYTAGTYGLDATLAGITQEIFTNENPVTAEVQLVNRTTGEVIDTRATDIGLPNGSPMTVHNLDPIAGNLLAPLGGFLLTPLGLNCTAGPWNLCSKLNIVSGGQWISNPCHVLSNTPVCFDLGIYETINTGKKHTNKDTGKVTFDFIDGNFLSLQGKSINWPGKIEKGTVQNWQYANKGYYFNVEDGGIVLDLEHAIGGVERSRTHYIDYYSN